MTRIGAEADNNLTQEFLLNIPAEFADNEIFEIAFMALTPEQQASALENLKALIKERQNLEPVELVTYLEGELAMVMSIAVPDIMERIGFWRKFKDEVVKYKTYSEN